MKQTNPGLILIHQAAYHSPKLQVTDSVALAVGYIQAKYL